MDDVALWQGKRFLPLAPAFLATNYISPIHVFEMDKTAKTLVPLLEPGKVPAAKLRNAISDGKRRDFFYFPETELEATLRFLENIISMVLTDPRLPLGLRCRAIHNLLTARARELFSSRTGLNFYRAVDTVRILTEFVREESEQTIDLLLPMLRRRYTNISHAVNVCVYGLAVSLDFFGWSNHRDYSDLAAAFFLHDIGKSHIAREILQKPGPLFESEWHEVQKHPGYGFTMVEKENILSQENRLVLSQHHERMDGKGYPAAMNGGAIHPHARVCSVVDAFDALTSEREFCAASSTFGALKIMKEDMHTQFDPGIFRSFVLLMKN